MNPPHARAVLTSFLIAAKVPDAYVDRHVDALAAFGASDMETLRLLSAEDWNHEDLKGIPPLHRTLIQRAITAVAGTPHPPIPVA
eukprot:CAMPEP_0174845152 /NCGR_PEP_ID=MMETSP1114-20130205/11554_1 /TAXON_ID=312471 /ORGANISM="Neobodo designis, Strain CCAP 1951/1" /LENGTH=84 /DNA_ID=CAMNT_0016079399 /DNA_START=37 /DNA_END=288 /DNA_ORIENTATION=+